MKKTIIILAAIVMGLTGCKKENAGTSVEKFRISASAAAVKTSLGSVSGNTQTVLWQAGDVLYVNGQTSDALAEGGSSSATFEFNSAISGTLYAAYPASAASNYSEGAATITLPAAQSYVNGSYDPAAALLLGTGSEGNVELKHMMAYLRITPAPGAEDVTIKSVELNSFGGVICGEFTTDFSTLAPAEGNEGYRVSVTPSSPVALGTALYIAIPAKSYNGKFELTIIDANDNFMKVTSEFSEGSPFNAVAGHIYPTSVVYRHQESLPENLYMLGDGTPGGWGSTTMLSGNGSGVYTLEGVSLSGGNFKIYPEDPQTSGNWAPYYGAATDATASNLKIEKVPSDSAPERNFNIERWGFTAGTYKVTVNLNTMTATFEKLNLRTAYLYGACFTGKDDWAYWCPLVETGNNTDVYSGEVDLITTDNWRGFKIYKEISDWNNEYCCDWGRTVDGDINNVYFDHKSITGDNQIYPYSFGVANGKNIVTVDFNTKKVSFSAVN